MNVSALLFRRVGDSLLATPALRALKHADGNVRLSVIAEPHVARVFESNPSVDDIIEIPAGPSPRQLASAIRRNGRPEAVLDFLSDPRSAMACFLSGARRRVGFDYPWRRLFYTDCVPRQNSEAPVYSAAHKLELARVLGATDRNVRLEFYLSDADRAFAADLWQTRGLEKEPPAIALFVHSRREFKRWPLECFASLIEQIHDSGTAFPLVLVTPGDEDSAARLQSLTSLPDRQLIKVSGLGQLGAVLERSRVLAGNDGGPSHLAAALGVSTVTVFNSGSPAYWTPPDPRHHVAFEASLDPVTKQSSISSLEVFDALRTLLTSPAHG